MGVTTILCWGGLLVTAIPWTVLLGVAFARLTYFSVLDWVKVEIFPRLNLR